MMVIFDLINHKILSSLPNFHSLNSFYVRVRKKKNICRSPKSHFSSLFCLFQFKIKIMSMFDDVDLRKWTLAKRNII